MTDHYETLGVARSASEDEIRQAFRRRAKAAHPDREGGDTDKMADLNRAYATLTDQSARTRYDETGLDPNLATLEQRAIAELRNIVSQISEQVEDGDFCAIIVQNLFNAQNTIANGRNLATARLRKYAKQRRRIVRKGGSESLFDCVFADKIANAEAALSQATEALEVVDHCIKLMGDYESLAEVPQWGPVVFMPTPAGSST